MTSRLNTWLLTFAVLCLGSSAHAASINFLIGSESSASFSQENFYGGNIEATLSNSLAGLNFTLSPGQSKTFEFFDISFSGCRVICGGKASVEAVLDFDSPSAAANGGGWGISKSIFGVITAGTLKWGEQPGRITTAAGVFDVTFEELAGLSFGESNTVHATVTAVSAVPLPAAAWLFGTSLLGLSGLSWGRKRKRNMLAD